MSRRTRILVCFQDEQYTTLAGNKRMDNPLPGTTEWCSWLEDDTIDAFGFTSEMGIHYTARRESRARGGAYWYAYRKQQGRLYKAYVGRTYELVLSRLIQVAEVLGERCVSNIKPVPAAAEHEEPGVFLMSAHDCAKDLIRYYVQRGDSLESLAYGHMGSYSERYHAQIGGLVKLPGAEKPCAIGCWKIAVTRIGKQDCCEIFNLHELYAELQSEIEAAARTAGTVYLMQLGATVRYWQLLRMDGNETVAVGQGEDNWRAFATTADLASLKKATRQAIHLCRNLGLELPTRPGEEEIAWCATMRAYYNGWCDHRQPGCYRDQRGNAWCQECFSHYQLLCYGESLGYPSIEADVTLTVKAGYDAWFKYAQMAGHRAVFLMARIARQLLDNRQAASSLSADCTHRRCSRSAVYHDYLGNGWCDLHREQWAMLNIGVILGFPALDAWEVGEGKDAWVQGTKNEARGDRIKKLLVYVQQLLLVEKREEKG